jgi:small redox-active disulfide protein 2
MNKIEILGTGCQKCKKLFETVQRTIKDYNIAAEVIKVEEINEIMKFGVMMTPALVINGEVKIVGRIPKSDEIKNMLLEKEESQ